MRIFPSYNTQAYYVNSRAYDASTQQFTSDALALGKTLSSPPKQGTFQRTAISKTDVTKLKDNGPDGEAGLQPLGGPTLFHTLPTGKGDPSAGIGQNWCHDIGLPSEFCDPINNFLAGPCKSLNIEWLCSYWPAILGGVGVIGLWMLFKKNKR